MRLTLPLLLCGALLMMALPVGADENPPTADSHSVVRKCYQLPQGELRDDCMAAARLVVCVLVEITGNNRIVVDPDNCVGSTIDRLTGGAAECEDREEEAEREDSCGSG